MANSYRRDWHAVFDVLFAVHDHSMKKLYGFEGWRTTTAEALVDSAAESDLHDQERHIEAVNVTLRNCDHLVEEQTITHIEQLPTSKHLIDVFQTARLGIFKAGSQSLWSLDSYQVLNPLGGTAAMLLKNLRPKTDFKGNLMHIKDWEDQWYKTIQLPALSMRLKNSPARAVGESISLNQAWFYATIQWAYYALWMGRISNDGLPSDRYLSKIAYFDFRKSDASTSTLANTFGATPGEIAWANDVGLDVAFLDRRILYEEGRKRDAALHGHTLRKHSLLKPQLGYRMRKIYGVDI